MEKIALEIYHKVLIPTDYSAACNNAVYFGLEFCRIYGCSAEIFHVDVENQKPSDEHLTMRTINFYRNSYNLDVDFVVSKGDVNQRIVNETSKNVFGFVILGTPGNNGFQRLTGSYASKVIQLANAPVIVVQNKNFKKLENIVLALSSDVEKIDAKKIAAIASFFNAKIHVMFSDEKISELFDLQSLIGNEKIIYKKITLNSAENSATQALNYCKETNADLLISVSSNNNQLNLRNEQLIFNVLQMPVMCLSN